MSWFSQNWSKRIVSWVSAGTSRSPKNRRRRGPETRRPDCFRCYPALMDLEDRSLPSVFFNPVFGNETQKQDNGAALSSPPVYLIFWGSWWGGTNSPQANAIKTAAAKVLASPFLRGLSPQYHSDGLAQLNSLAAYDNNPNPADLGFGAQQIDDVVQNEIDNGPLPESDDGPHTPIYVVVTPPGIQSNLGRGVTGFNQLGHDSDLFDSDDIPEVWAWTGNTKDANGNYILNIDQFTLTLSHEVAEIMSDLGGFGYKVNPGPKWAAGGSGNQIGDYEGNSYQWREPNGALIQPYWSARDQRWLAVDGNSQAVFLDPQWNWNGISCGQNNCSYTGRNTLTVNGHTALDTITVDTSGGGVRVTLNGEVFPFDPGQISNIIVNTGNGNDTVTIRATLPGVGVTVNLGSGTDTVTVGDTGASSDLGNIQGNVTIHPGSGVDTLNVNDWFSRGSHTYFLTSNSVRRSDTATITYAGINNVNINGSLSGNNIYNVNGTEVGWTTILSTGNGVDTVNVESTNWGTFAINEGSGGVTVNISPTARTLNNIQGTINVEGSSSGTDNLVIDDRGSSATQAYTYTLNAFSFTRGGSGTINTNNRISNVTLWGSRGNDIYHVTGTGALTLTAINAGLGGNTVNIEGTSRPLTVNLGNGTDAVKVSSSARNLDTIQGAVTVTGGSGHGTLDINDQNKRFDQFHLGVYTITNSTVQRFGAPAISYSHVSAVGVFAGADTAGFPIQFSIPSTAAGTQTNLTTQLGAGLNVISVGNSGNSLDGIQGPLSVFGSDFDQLGIADQGKRFDQTNPGVYTITSSSVQRSGAAAINYSNIPFLAVSTGVGLSVAIPAQVSITSTAASTGTVLNMQAANTANVQSASNAGVVINGGSSADIVNLGSNNILANILGPVTINDTVGSVQVNLYDAADRDSHPNAQLSQGRLIGLAPAAINFGPSAVANLTINDGLGNNVYTITGCPSTVLNAGPGTDTIHVQGLPPFTHLTLNTSAGSGADTITLGDASQTLSGINGMLSSIGLSGRPGDTLLINDQGYTGGRSYFLTPTTLRWTFGPPVSYSGLTWMFLNGSQGGNTFDLSGGTASNAWALYGGSGTNYLIGSNSGNTWLITGPAPDTGYLRGPAYVGSVSFYHMGNLTGGNGGDIFQFFDQATLSGNLAGGPNTTLDYSLYSTSVIVDLQTGFATGVGGSVSGISSVIGGSAAPGTAGLYNLLIGNGNNTLTGGTGRRNILVAGGSASTLNAGDGEDLLIGGSTMYDNDPTDPGLTNWQAIAAYWAGTDDYFTRVGNLTSGNGVPLLDATTVTGNSGGNTINGMGALALIYSDGMDNTSGFDPNSIIVPMTP